MYEGDEVEALLDALGVSESLKETEERLARKWIEQRSRDGKSPAEMFEQIMAVIGEENDSANYGV